MKIIDLLNKIAKGEVPPENIKYGEEIYNRTKVIKDNGEYWYNYLNEDTTCLLFDTSEMNNEVEILEEEKKIPENNFNYIYSCEDEYIMANFENIKTTLKDIIDYLKSKGDE